MVCGPVVEDLCESALTDPVFIYLVLFIWITRMLGEFRTVVLLHRTLHKMPGRPEDAGQDEMVSLNEEDSSEYIVFLTRAARMAIYVSVVFPKFMVCMILTYSGSEWLVATESFTDLILNALALEFIVGIDESILTNFFPERMLETLENCKFAPPKPVREPEEEIIVKLHEYYESMVYIISAFLVTYVYIFHIQQVIPHFTFDLAGACQDPKITMKYEPPCPFFDESCFPYGPDTPDIPGMKAGCAPRRKKKHGKKRHSSLGSDARRLLVEDLERPAELSTLTPLFGLKEPFAQAMFMPLE